MSEVNIKTGKDIVAKELTALRHAVNWVCHSSCAEIERSIEAYPFIAQARNEADELVGYLCVFSDGVFITIIGELLVHPDYQRQGIGTALLKKAERRYPGTPVYVNSFYDSLPIFSSQGYTSSEWVKHVMLKNKTRGNEFPVQWDGLAVAQNR